MGRKADKKIKDFIQKVRRVYSLEKAILFGSRARGDEFNNSDYDVIMVSKDFDKIFFSKRIADITAFWNHYPLEIEPICYTPKEFKKKSREHGIVRQAIREGIEL